MLATATDPWIPFEPDITEVTGRLDSATALGVEEDALLCIDSGARRLILDCHGLTYITAAGLRSLMALARVMKNSGGHFAVCGLQSQAAEMLESTGFDGIITIYRNTDHAIAALAG